MFKIKIPKNCSKIINMIEQSNFDAYMVGGCVRDSLLGLEPNDWDIATNATPTQIKELFKNAHNYAVTSTGEKYGTITVFCKDDKKTYEVTTFRLDGNYTDGRHPDSVTFSNNIEDDLARRDFTINAMAYNDNKGIIDLFDGQKHLKEKTLFFVGNPYERLKEDGLRIMRAIRFAYKLKFIIENASYEAIKHSISNGYLKNLSKERVRDELISILEFFYYDNNYILFETMILNIIPELKSMVGKEQHCPYHIYDIWNHSVIAMSNTPNDAVLRLTMLLHDIGKVETFNLDNNGIGHFYGHPKISCEISRKILSKLKFDNKTKDNILMLIKQHEVPFILTKKWVKKMLGKIGEKAFRQLLYVRFADNVAHNPRYFYEKHKKLESIKNIFNGVLEENECFSLKNLNINGNDLIRLGLKGREIGKWLNRCLDLVISDNTQNDNKTLVEYIINNKNSNDS